VLPTIAFAVDATGLSALSATLTDFFSIYKYFRITHLHVRTNYLTTPTSGNATASVTFFHPIRNTAPSNLGEIETIYQSNIMISPYNTAAISSSSQPAELTMTRSAFVDTPQTWKVSFDVTSNQTSDSTYGFIYVAETGTLSQTMLLQVEIHIDFSHCSDPVDWTLIAQQHEFFHGVSCSHMKRGLTSNSCASHPTPDVSYIGESSTTMDSGKVVTSEPYSEPVLVSCDCPNCKDMEDKKST
jgi:hypothetical protein